MKRRHIDMGRLIAGRAVTPEKPFIIAEVGINHNGNIENAYKMISAAKASGADCVKFQTFKTEEFVGDRKLLYTYKSRGRSVTEPIFDMFKRHEFSPDAWVKIRRRCDKEGIQFLSTPQNVGDLKILLKLGIKAVKIGSDDFTNIPLIRAYAKTGLPLLLSCGMADLGEVHRALEAAGFFDGYPVALFVCTSQYPTPPQDVNIKRLSTLAQAFPGLMLGFSDHTQGSRAAVMASALGAVIFEKHFTLSHSLPGPDHWFSEDPAGLKEWVQSIRTASSMLGNGVVRPTKVEAVNKRQFARVIVALEDIARGEKFTDANIGMRRMRTPSGLPAGLYDLFVGKPARKDYSKGQALEL